MGVRSYKGKKYEKKMRIPLLREIREQINRIKILVM